MGYRGCYMRVAITGASGLIGTALSRSLIADGHSVLRLVRRAARSAGELAWDPGATAGGIDPAALSDVDAVVHLAGAPIAAQRWTQARKNVLVRSRVQATGALVAALAAAPERPGVLLSGSAIGWYGDTGETIVDESAPVGTGFLADLVRDWEAAAQAASSAGIRVVMLRTGVVLARDGGMLPRLVPPFRFGLGAAIGSGRQYLSWISLTDHVRATRFALDAQALAGPVNLTSPNPVTNAQFTAELARALHRPARLRLPPAVLRAALGEVSSELLSSARVVPRKLTDAGFTFSEPEIGQALAAALG